MKLFKDVSKIEKVVSNTDFVVVRLLFLFWKFRSSFLRKFQNNIKRFYNLRAASCELRVVNCNFKKINLRVASVPSRKLQRNFTSCKFILWVGKNYELQVPSVGTRFQLKLTILNFGNKFAKKGDFPAENGKSEHRQWILHIRISLGTKFQLKLKILNFLTKLTQKRIFFSLSQKKWRPPLNSASSN